MFGAPARPTSDLIRTMRNSGKPVSALCMGPAVLAAAGVLQGKRVTFFDDPKVRWQVASGGGKADLKERVVEVHDDSGLGPVITGRDQGPAREFARAVLRAAHR